MVQTNSGNESQSVTIWLIRFDSYLERCVFDFSSVAPLVIFCLLSQYVMDGQEASAKLNVNKDNNSSEVKCLCRLRSVVTGHKLKFSCQHFNFANNSGISSTRPESPKRSVFSYLKLHLCGQKAKTHRKRFILINVSTCGHLCCTSPFSSPHFLSASQPNTVS